jgi:hypothetical protein
LSAFSSPQAVSTDLKFDITARAILSVSMLPEAIRREMVKSLAMDAKSLDVRLDMVELLAHVGDESSLIFLREMAKQGTNPALTKVAAAKMGSAITVAAECLNEKLKYPEAEQWQWSQCGVICWRAIREVVKPANLHGEYEWAAENIIGSGVLCPAVFLNRRIRSGDPVAFALAAIQKEELAVGALGEAANADGACRGRALAVLIRIGTEDAIRMLAKRMVPSTIRENEAIAKQLSDYGTNAAIKMLDELMTDDRYRQSWPAFQTAQKRIAAKIAQRDSDAENAGKTKGERQDKKKDIDKK